ncbi:MAG: hypothetical protein HN352_18535 [Bacteroidetes bacterium]|jgi:type IV pilus assembly protein PilB|nr:hypothetical protein [Bacteroidota bacterium]
MNPLIKELIINDASEAEIRKVAQESGTNSIFDEGILKAQQGMTTLEEVIRVA